MMGERTVTQEELFYGFCLEQHVPANHLLRAIDRFVDLSDIRQKLAPFYSAIGRPSIDPELLIRMLIVGYCSGIRSERRLCEEVHLNLLIDSFAGWALRAMSPIILLFQRRGMAASAKPICCANCSKPWSAAAWWKGLSVAMASRSTPA